MRRRGELLALDLPARPPVPREPDPAVAGALGREPQALLEARDLIAVLGSAGEVAALEPDLAAVAALDTFALVATAAGADCDFVSRFFAPRQGVPEDPVTGSSHCSLVPYWSQQLGRRRLRARQLSRRGGELFCRERGERVEIAGRVVEYLRGEIELPS